MIDVSVVVPVRDDPEGVARLLAALERQTLERARFEVVLADDGSAEPVRAPGARVLRGPPVNSYAARNRAVRVARGRVLAFTDADCRPEPSWLEAGLRALRDADVCAGLVHFDVSPGGSPWELIDAESYIDQRRWLTRDCACTANLLVRRPLLERLGGFDESLPSGGDFDLVRRAAGAGASIVLAEDAVVRHPARRTARGVLRKHWRVTYNGTLRAVRDRVATERPRLALVVPLACTISHRRDHRRPVARLDEARLAESGVAVRRRDHVLCLALVYLVLDPVAAVARAVGGVRGLAARAYRGSSIDPSSRIVQRGL